jgi:hypothetical protein
MNPPTSSSIIVSPFRTIVLGPDGVAEAGGDREGKEVHETTSKRSIKPIK